MLEQAQSIPSNKSSRGSIQLAALAGTPFKGTFH